MSAELWGLLYFSPGDGEAIVCNETLRRDWSAVQGSCCEQCNSIVNTFCV